MKKSMKYLAPAMVLALAVSPAAKADDLSGVDSILCAASIATVCTPDGDCLTAPPWNWNIPGFIEIDLKGKIMKTTQASGENRSTSVRTMERTDGLILLQGMEQQRAFSFQINEETGMVSVAVARDGVVVSVFGTCTPMVTAAAK